MAFSIKNIFGSGRAAEGASKSSLSNATESGAVYFEILQRYSNRMRPLGDHVKFDLEEENRLRALRADAYAARHDGHRSSDVFMEYPYERVDPNHVIKSVTLKPSAPKKLPEFSAVLHTNVVSDRVRKGIESLEPGKHAFYPLDVVSSDGTEIHKYHFIQYLEKTDCVDRERSGYGKGVRDDGSVYWFRDTDRKKVLLTGKMRGRAPFVLGQGRDLPYLHFQCAGRKTWPLSTGWSLSRSSCPHQRAGKSGNDHDTLKATRYFGRKHQQIRAWREHLRSSRVNSVEAADQPHHSRELAGAPARLTSPAICGGRNRVERLHHDEPL